jgi:flagellar biosynthetic protein FliO
MARALSLIAAVLMPLAFVAGASASLGVVDWEYSFVNMRTAPSTGAKKILRIPEGTEVEIVEDRGEWSLIGHAGKKGWVVSRSVQPLKPSVAPVRIAEEIVAPPELNAPAAPAPNTASAQTALQEGQIAEDAPSPEPVVPVKAEVEDIEPARLDVATPAATSAQKSEAPTGGYLSNVAEREEMPALDLGSSLINMFVGLLVVLGIIGGIVWFMKRFLGGKLPGVQGNAAIRVLTTRPLGSRQALLLVDVGGDAYLLAQSEGGIDFLAKIDSPEAVDRLDYLFEYRTKPFEAELRRQVDLESEGAGEGDAADAEAATSAEERLNMLRQRPKKPESQ